MGMRPGARGGRGGGARNAPRGTVALALVWICCSAAYVPADTRVATLTPHEMVILGDGRVLSTMTLCPSFAFATLGPGSPRLSPDRHYLLVDILGPFEPADVGRTHAIVDVLSGGVVLSQLFPEYFGVPGSLEPLAWASGERAVLRYQNGTTARLHEPPLKALPRNPCPAAQPSP